MAVPPLSPSENRKCRAQGKPHPVFFLPRLSPPPRPQPALAAAVPSPADGELADPPLPEPAGPSSTGLCSCSQTCISSTCAGRRPPQTGSFLPPFWSEFSANVNHPASLTRPDLGPQGASGEASGLWSHSPSGAFPTTAPPAAAERSSSGARTGQVTPGSTLHQVHSGRREDVVPPGLPWVTHRPAAQRRG